MGNFRFTAPAILVFSILGQYSTPETSFAQSYNVVQKKDLVYPIAGTGDTTYSGDGASALYAGLNDPTGIAVDNEGNLYIADSGNHVIRKIDAETGTITTIAGTGTAGFSGESGPALEMQLNNPQYLDVAENGDLFISDVDNSRLRKLDAKTGILSTVYGTPTLIPGQIAIDELKGIVYFTDRYDEREVRYSSSRQDSSLIGSVMRILPSGNIVPFIKTPKGWGGAPEFRNELDVDLLGNPFFLKHQGSTKTAIVRYNRDSVTQDSIFATSGYTIKTFAVSIPDIFFARSFRSYAYDKLVFRYGTIEEGAGFQTVGKEEIGTFTGTISDMVMDLEGNVIFADREENKIYRITNNKGFEPNIQVPQAVDLDEIVVGTSKSRLLSLSNEGNMRLSVLSISSSIPDLSFVPVSSEIESGDSSSIAITIKPSTAGPISGTISILSTDPDQGNASVPFSATSFSAQLQMDLEKGPNNHNVLTMKGVTTADTITVQIFGTDMPKLIGYQITLNYDDAFIDSESFSFKSGSLLPDALTVLDHAENSITVSAAITGETYSALRSGLMGSLNFAITDNLASTDSTSIRLAKATFSLADESIVDIPRRGTITLFAGESVVGDFDGDGSVGFPDFLQFAQLFGKQTTDVDFDSRFDLDNDGTIGFSDFLKFAAAFGT